MTSWLYSADVSPYMIINALFLFQLLGWVMECIVIRHEKGRLGKTVAFCPVRSASFTWFGAILGYALLRPFRTIWNSLYQIVAVLATLFGSTSRRA